MTRQERAGLARRLQEIRAPDWERFLADWTSLNAVYNGFRSGSERDSLMTAARELIGAADAETLLDALADDIAFFEALPPGDMRRQGQEAFRARSTEDMRVVIDAAAGPTERVARLLAVVYQVRCNLAHGDKDPAVERDRQLVTRSGRIIREVLPILLRELDQSSSVDPSNGTPAPN